jgi:uncharacterized protein (TIRG00374 family)
MTKIETVLPGPGLKHTLRRAEYWLIGSVAASVAAVAAVAAIVGTGPLVAEIGRLTLAELAGLLALSLVNYGARTLRWQIFARRIGLTLSWGRCTLYYFSGFAMTITPGRVGEVLRLWLMRQGHGIRYERSASLAVADRLSDIGGMVLLCLLSLSAFTGHARAIATLTLVMAGLTITLLHAGLPIRLVNALYARVRRAPRLFARTRTFLRHLNRLGSWRTYGGTLLLSLLGWFAEALALYWIAAIMGADVNLPQALFVFVFSTIAGALALLPGGIGGAEVSLVALLTALGVGFETAVAVTAVFRATTLWFSVALGLMALPLALRLVRHRPPAPDRGSALEPPKAGGPSNP